MTRASLIIFLLTGCVHMLPPPSGALDCGGIPRCYCVDSCGTARAFYRSGQPHEGELFTVATKYGVRTVIKLNEGWQGHDDLPIGVDLIHHPINVLADLPPDEINLILDDIDTALEKGPVLVHCTLGEDRTGLLIGLWRLRHDPVLKPEFVWNEMVNFGFHDGKFNTPGLKQLIETFTKMTGYKP